MNELTPYPFGDPMSKKRDVQTSQPVPDSAEGIATSTESPDKPKRKRRETACRIEKQAVMVDGEINLNPPTLKPVGDGVFDTLNFETCEDAADGLKKVVDSKKPGKYRIIRVLREFEVKVETVSKATIV